MQHICVSWGSQQTSSGFSTLLQAQFFIVTVWAGHEGSKTLPSVGTKGKLQKEVLSKNWLVIMVLVIIARGSGCESWSLVISVVVGGKIQPKYSPQGTEYMSWCLCVQRNRMRRLSDTRVKRLAQWEMCVSHKLKNLSARVHNPYKAIYGGVRYSDAGIGESLEAQRPAGLFHRAWTRDPVSDTYAHMHKHMHMHTGTHTCTHMCTYTQAHMQVPTCMCMYRE